MKCVSHQHLPSGRLDLLHLCLLSFSSCGGTGAGRACPPYLTPHSIPLQGLIPRWKKVPQDLHAPDHPSFVRTLLGWQTPWLKSLTSHGTLDIQAPFLSPSFLNKNKFLRPERLGIRVGWFRATSDRAGAQPVTIAPVLQLLYGPRPGWRSSSL